MMDRQDYEETLALLRAKVDSAREEYQAAKQEHEHATAVLKDIGYAASPDGTMAHHTAQTATKRQSQAYYDYMNALRRYNDLIFQRFPWVNQRTPI